MFSLIKKEDALVLQNSNFVKNALLFKDMLAFYDVYEKLQETKKEDLPNYMIDAKGNFLLDGVCLFMRLYASEFAFESLKLSIDYLKVIYYTIASFANKKGEVERKEIELELNIYKKASAEAIAEATEKSLEEEKKFKVKEEQYNKLSATHSRKLVAASLFNVFYVMFLVSSFLVAMLPIALHIDGKIKLGVAIAISLSTLAGGIALTVLFKFLTKYFVTASNDMAYSVSSYKREKENAYQKFRTEKGKLNRIISEKYEYSHYFTKGLSKFVKPMKFEDVLERSKEYKLVSYNLIYDIHRLFKNFKKDKEEMIAVVSAVKKEENYVKNLSEIYAKIKEQDSLFFNNEIRFAFLKKFIECAEVYHDWKILEGDKKINPFGIYTKALAKEEIAYLESPDGLFVSTSLDKFMGTKYVKKLNEFEIKNKEKVDDLKEIKTGYIEHFYDYDKLKTYTNLFYDKKINSGVKIDEDLLAKHGKIPTYVCMKIKRLESFVGLENSDSFAVKQIANSLGKIEIED